MVGSTLAVAIFGYDIAMIDRLAALVAPFGELDERHGLRLLHDLVQVIAELMAGRVKHARELRSELITRLRDPQRYLGVPTACASRSSPRSCTRAACARPLRTPDARSRWPTRSTRSA